ncbi:hypothetical protein [Bacillus sp. FJAT-45350]|nr:hypothetical protein [Bacillus sp. FJAT-45350]
MFGGGGYNLLSIVEVYKKGSSPGSMYEEEQWFRTLHDFMRNPLIKS